MSKQSRFKKKHRLGEVLKPSPVNKPPNRQTYPNLKSVYLSKIALISAFITILSLLIVYLKPGLPAGHDIAAHAIRSKMMVEELSQGQFPVRWVAWIKNGESEPLFNFYQSGFYYLIALIHLFVGLTTSLKVLPLLLWWSGSVFIFLWMRRLGNLPAALATLIYTFTPYIILDALVRAAYPELGAISLSVGLLWSSERLLTSAKRHFAIPVSLCLAAVLLFHLPTAVILLPVIAGYLLLLIIQKEAKSIGAKYLGVSCLLGMGLAGFYIIPALGELNLIKSSLLSSDYYDFHQHFVYFQQLFSTYWGYGISKAGLNDGMSFQFGMIQWLIIGLGIACIWIKQFTKDKIFIIFWLLTIPYAIFFMHEISVNSWENLRPISFVQYPWRYLMVVAISCACISGILVSHFKQLYQTFAVFITIAAIVILYSRYLTPPVYLPAEYFNIDSDQWRTSQGVRENSYYEVSYLPKDVLELPQEGINSWEIVQGKGLVNEKLAKSYNFIFTSNGKEPLTLKLNSHFFPGWKGFIDNQEVGLLVDPKTQYMAVSIPSGIHKIEVVFINTPLRSAANTISVLSLIALALWQAKNHILRD